jgi:hypothetical protein
MENTHVTSYYKGTVIYNGIEYTYRESYVKLSLVFIKSFEAWLKKQSKSTS